MKAHIHGLKRLVRLTGYLGSKPFLAEQRGHGNFLGHLFGAFDEVPVRPVQPGKLGPLEVRWGWPDLFNPWIGVIHIALIMLLCFRAFAAIEPTILYEEDGSLLTTEINVVVLTGSQDDPKDKIGTAHLLAELMLRGTKKKSRQKFQLEIEKLGGALGVGTYHDRVIFSGSVIRENTIAFLELLGECLLHPALAKDELESLRTEVLAEITNIKNNNGRLGGLAIRKEAFSGTPLERPVQGTTKTVKSINHEELVRSYNNRFHRGSLLFAVTSSLKEAEVKKVLAALWHKFPDGFKTIRKSFAPRIPRNLQLIVVHKPKTSTGALLLAQTGMTAQDPNRYILSTGDFAFGGNVLVSRLFRVVRGENGWTYAIVSSYGAMGSLSYQQGLYIISATPTVEFTLKSLFKVLSMWKDYVKEGLNSNELKISQESLINSYPFQFETPQKRLAERLHSHLYEVPILSQEEYANTIHGISRDLIKKALSQQHQSVGWLVSIVADKTVVEQQLKEEQIGIPESKQLKISKVFSPEDIVN